MRLVTLSYKEYEGRDQEWILDHLALGSRNLLVGKNATGRSRTLNVFVGAARVRFPPAPSAAVVRLHDCTIAHTRNGVHCMHCTALQRMQSMQYMQ